MGPNPEPEIVWTVLDRQRTVVKADAGRPESANLLEM